MGPYDGIYTPRVQQTAYQLPELRPAPSFAPSPNTGGNTFSGQGMDPISAGMNLAAGIGNALMANAQRKEARRTLNIQNTTGDNQFAANFGLSKDAQWWNKQNQLYDRQRYAANQTARAPMLQAIANQLAGVAGVGGLGAAIAPSLAPLIAAGNAPLGTYTPYKSTGKQTVKNMSYYNPNG